MILVGLGANLPSTEHGSPRATLDAALGRFPGAGITVLRRSRWYSTGPQPASDQPRYVNAVASVATHRQPRSLLDALLEIEDAFGRVRSIRNAARLIDLDLLAYHDVICSDPGLTLPHPRLRERAFVVYPLADVAPEWRDPVSGETIDRLVAALPPDQDVRLLAE